MRQCAGQVEVVGAALADHDAVGGLVDFLVGANRRIVPDQLAVQARRAAEARAAAALQAEQWAEAKRSRTDRCREGDPRAIAPSDHELGGIDRRTPP